MSTVIMLSGVMLSVIMPTVVMPNVIMLSVIMPNVIMFSFIMLSVIMPTATVAECRGAVFSRIKSFTFSFVS